MPPRDQPKLHLNEHLSPRLAQQLHKHGFDVTSSQTAELLTKSDRDQLEYACAQERAILTFNIDDFTALHEAFAAEGKEHWGIILSTREPIGVLLHRLLRLLNTLSADELKNQIRWLNEFN